MFPHKLRYQPPSPPPRHQATGMEAKAARVPSFVRSAPHGFRSNHLGTLQYYSSRNVGSERIPTDLRELQALPSLWVTPARLTNFLEAAPVPGQLQMSTPFLVDMAMT